MTRSKKNFLRIAALLTLIAVMAFTFISCGKDEEGTTGAEIKITVEVVDKDGNSKEHEIKTEKTTLADALLEAKLVEGTTDEYGLYITTVDGMVADYNVDQSYWAISKNGEMLMTGASSTNIADGEHYELTYTVTNGN